MADRNDEPPFQGGSQPVPERPTRPPSPGRSAVHYVVIALAFLVLLAILSWVLIPLISGSRT